MRRAGNLRIWLSLLAFVVIVALFDYLLLDYLMSHGLEAKTQTVQLGGFQLFVPLLGLPFVGLLIVAVAAWGHISTTMPITTLREMSQLETARMFRAAGAAIFLFSIVLFGPYLIGTNGFWNGMASLSRSVPQLSGSLQGFFFAVQPLMGLDVLAKLAISQNAAAAALVIVSILIGRRQIRARRTR
jgi:hypothetical protein